MFQAMQSLPRRWGGAARTWALMATLAGGALVTATPAMAGNVGISVGIHVPGVPVYVAPPPPPPRAVYYAPPPRVYMPPPRVVYAPPPPPRYWGGPGHGKPKHHHRHPPAHRHHR